VELNTDLMSQHDMKKVLNKKEKREAIKHLKSLQDQVASLMQNLM